MGAAREGELDQCRMDRLGRSLTGPDQGIARDRGRREEGGDGFAQGLDLLVQPGMVDRGIVKQVPFALCGDGHGLDNPQHILDAFAQGRALPKKVIAALGPGIEGRAGYRKHLSALFGRKPCGNERARAHLGLDHHHAQRQS